MEPFQFELGQVVTLKVALLPPRPVQLPRLLLISREEDRKGCHTYSARTVVFSRDQPVWSIEHGWSQFMEEELVAWPEDADRNPALEDWRELAALTKEITAERREWAAADEAIRAALSGESTPPQGEVG